MSKRAFDKIKAGLDSARSYLDGTADERHYRVRVPEKINVRKIRGPDEESTPHRPGRRLSAPKDRRPREGGDP